MYRIAGEQVDRSVDGDADLVSNEVDASFRTFGVSTRRVPQTFSKWG